MNRTYFRVLSLAMLCSAMAVTPASAETLEELDALALVTENEEAGIEFAQSQIERSEHLEAIGTIERVLALHPKSQPARLLHAALLCLIDDRIGGAVELSKLKQKNFTDQEWNQALAVCAEPQSAEAAATAAVEE